MKSIATKFAAVFGVFALVFSAFAVYRTWSVSEAHVRELTGRQAELALEFDLAIRKYVGEHIRPAMQQKVGPDEFHPETMSTSFIARSVFEKVRKKFPDYIIRFSSGNPRNPANQAGPEELRIIEYFNRNPGAERWSGEVVIGDKLYYAHFNARRMKESCLRCHGDPADAPASLLERYGRTAGFHRPVGDVIALDTVAIPMDKINAALASGAIKHSAVLVIALGLLFVGILVMFRLLVSRRLAAISGHFKRAAADADIPELSHLAVGGRDEIGVLACGYNALVTRLQELYASLEMAVQQRTEELAISNEKLRQKMRQLEQFNRLAVGREQRMIELKRQVNEFARKAGAAPPYKSSEQRHADSVASVAPESQATVER